MSQATDIAALKIADLLSQFDDHERSQVMHGVSLWFCLVCWMDKDDRTYCYCTCDD